MQFFKQELTEAIAAGYNELLGVVIRHPVQQIDPMQLTKGKHSVPTARSNQQSRHLCVSIVMLRYGNAREP